LKVATDLPPTVSTGSPPGKTWHGRPTLNEREWEGEMDNSTATRSAYDRLNAGDIDGFGALLADDFVEHEETPGFPPTKEGVKEFFRMYRAAFPDLHMDAEDVLADGDKTVARVRATGTHRGELMGIPPTGKRVNIELIDIMQFDDSGTVSEHWGLFDTMSMMQQLGVVPAGPPA